MGGCFFCRWARRRPRRLLLNGPRPHPSSPRHDHPTRPLGARPHRLWRARHSGPNDCIVWSRRIQLNPSRSKPGPEDSIQSAKPPLSLGALVGCFYKILKINYLQMYLGNFRALFQVHAPPKMCGFFHRFTKFAHHSHFYVAPVAQMKTASNPARTSDVNANRGRAAAGRASESFRSNAPNPQLSHTARLPAVVPSLHAER